MPGGAVAIGGGGLGLLILVVGLIFGVDPSVLTSVVEQTQTSQQSAPTDAGQQSTLAQDCKVGADANNREDCRIVGIVNSVQDYWSKELPKQGGQYSLKRK